MVTLNPEVFAHFLLEEQVSKYWVLKRESQVLGMWPIGFSSSCTWAALQRA